MGKIVISNNNEWLESLDSIYSNFGFDASFRNHSFISFKKMFVKNYNYFTDDNRYVVCVGTWAYKNNTGKKGLEMLFHDYFDLGISIKNIRLNCLGTYAIIFGDNEKNIVFVDENHTYALYYYFDGKQYLITNTYYHVQRFACQEINSEAFVLMLAKTGLSSNLTPFKNIYRLMEDEVLIIKDDFLSLMKVETNSYNCPFINEEDVFDYVRREIESAYKILSSQSKKKFLFATGGADSRLRLALDLSQGKDVDIGYWSGSDVITNGTENDAKVNKMLANHLGLKTELFDVSEDFKECIDSITIGECDKYGEYLFIYAHNRKWLDIPYLLRDKGIDEVELGYDPDILRPVDQIETSFKVPFSANVLVEKACFRSGIFGRILKSDKVSTYAIEDISKLLEDVDPNNLTIEEAINIFNYSRLDMGDIIVNYFNQFYYCNPLMYTKKLWDIIGSLKYDIKRDDYLSVKLSFNWSPRIMDVPIFSHNHFLKYDRNNYKLCKTIKHTLLSRLKPFVIKTRLYDFIYVKYFEKLFFPENSSSEKLFKECIDYLSQFRVINNLPVSMIEGATRKGFDLAALGTIVAKIKFLEIINTNLIKKKDI